MKVWSYYFETCAGFIDKYSFTSLEAADKSRSKALNDSWYFKVGKIFEEVIDSKEIDDD